ncbi:3',5'-cyclic-nucleotide phosphodiesterase regA [Diabrotica virgifera virgifera]|uniref:3',5'-cyclic-nucleotide phosphodiesterase regA-like n=1 Tax=Diabrotica virgifera virgifera TaxID=50390 RepID=A0A6P7F7G9_DIAVI|nr:3',5'-cyclic-nucleotide phosphodiesterase regA [Diabrotica virgifera virgifera]
MYCPLCNTELQLKQINFTEAIYLCPDISCSYPTNNQCTVVKRRLEGIKRTRKPKSNKEKYKSSHGSDNNSDNNTDFDLDELISSALVHLNSSSLEKSNMSSNVDNTNGNYLSENVQSEQGFDKELEDFLNGLDNS